MRGITFTLWTRNEGEQHDSRIRCHDTSPQEAFDGVFREIDQTPELIWLIDAEQPEDVRKVWRIRQNQDPSEHYYCDPPTATREGTHHCRPEYRDNVAIGVTIRTQADANRLIPELLKLADLCPVLFVRLVPTEWVDLGLQSATCDCCPRWPSRWVRLPADVHGDWPLGHTSFAKAGIYRAESNQHGALSLPDQHGRPLGIKPAEFECLPTIHWLTLAGDTEPLHPDWVRSARDQCAAAGVPFRFEGWGEWCGYDAVGSTGWEYTRGDYPRFGRLIDGPLVGQEFETLYPWTGSIDPGPCMVRVGRERSGRTLDGCTHDEYPEAFLREDAK